MGLKKLLQASLLSAGFACAVSASAQGASTSNPVVAPPLEVGFVYVTPVLPAGWTAQHDAGRREMEAALGAKVRTRVVADVPESADAERVLRELAQGGAKLIFATSFGYGPYVQRVAKEFADVKFEHITGYQSAPNVAFANARYYEGRYLAGMLAGGMTRSNLIGYVAGFPIPEVVQGINAFARGAREVNPKATVQVLWTNSWFDPPKEGEAANTLIAKGADVLTYHLGSPAVARAAQSAGKWLVAYHSDMRAFAPTRQLAAVTHHWGGYYTEQARNAIAGNWSHRAVWGGIKDGMVKLEFISEAVPAALRERVAQREREIAAGRFHPFTAPVIDSDGRTRLAQGAMSDAQLQQMDFLVQGVAGGLPVR
jgi:simple sugar transport system substrate-binding protein